MPSTMPSLVLDSVVYQEEEGDKQFLLNWSIGRPALARFAVEMQLFRNQALVTAEGQPVVTALSDPLSGTWSASMAGFPLNDDILHWIAVRAVDKVTGATEVGEWSAPVPVIFQSQPTLRMVDFDGERLVVAWALPATADRVNNVRVTIVDGVGGVIETLEVGGLGSPCLVPSLTLAAPDDFCHGFDLGTVPLSLARTALNLLQVGIAAAYTEDGVLSVGPVTSGSLLCQQPVVEQADTDPLTGKVKVTWSDARAVSYRVQSLRGGVPSGPASLIQDIDVTFDAFPAGEDISVTVTPARMESGTALIGPASAPFPIPTVPATLLSLDYNGTTVQATWSPVPGATSYRLTVIQSGNTNPFFQQAAPAGATRFDFPIDISDVTQTYSVVLQACYGNPSSITSGPPSQPWPLFTPALFLSRQPVTEAWPSIYPAADISLSITDRVLYLSDLGVDGVLAGLPLTQGPFTLAENADPATEAAFPYTLTIAADAGSFDTSPVREQLQSDYVAFLQAAERKLIPAMGIAALQQVISRNLPQTFQETLFYEYGLDLTAGSVDLRPGMVLRVSFSDYLSVPVTSPKWLSGYSGGAVVDYELDSYLNQGKWSVSFDGFLAQLVSNGVLEVATPPGSVPQQSQAGVADAADLLFPTFRQPFYRLFFPAQLKTPTGIGTVLPAESFAIAAASSYTGLGTAVNFPSEGNAVAYFRGRAILRVCIRVFVNGNEVVVPLGTTVGNLLDRYARRPPSTRTPLKGLVLERTRGPGVLDPAAGYDVSATYRVRLDWQSLPVYWWGLDALSLPLLHGDSLSFTG